MIAVTQFIIFFTLFLLARAIYPLCTPEMIGNLTACDGIVLFATGFRMLKLKDFPVADMIPAMILVMPVSCCWAAYIVPLLA